MFLIAYAADVGRGFISDDFAWILHGRLGGGDDLRRIFTSSVGFFRPLVSLSFGLNYAALGLTPRGFGFTNLLLAVACAAGIVALARQLGLRVGAALVAAALWLFNFHGIGMALLWLSGRTSLLLTLFSVLAAIAFLRGRWSLAAAAAGAAMLSKEEAALLPVMFTVWWLAQRRHMTRPVRSALTQVLPLWAILAAYLVLRFSSGAFWPTNAPSFYAPTLDPARLWQSLIEYGDRTFTFSLLAILAASLAVRSLPQWKGGFARILPFAISWLICGFAVTFFLPVRSSLYAVFPSVAVVIAAAAVIESTLAALQPSARLRLAWLGVLTLTLLVPVYWMRNERWTSLAELSSAVVAQLNDVRADLPVGTTIIIRDDMTTRTNLSTAWGGLTQELAALAFGGDITLQVLQDDDSAAAAASGGIVTRLQNGKLIGLPTPAPGR